MGVKCRLLTLEEGERKKVEIGRRRSFVEEQTLSIIEREEESAPGFLLGAILK